MQTSLQIKLLWFGLLLVSGSLARALENDPAALTDELKKLKLDELSEIEIPTVYAASKHEQKATEAPSSVSVVTANEISEYGYRSLAEVLRSVRGFYVTYDRNYGYIGVRGFNRPGDFGGRVLLMVDGHRLNEPIFDSAFNMSDFILDVDLIDRVEVIRGPGSSLYGDNAFFAVVNVITRRGPQINGAEVSAAGGSYGTYQGRTSVGKQFTNGVDLLFSGTIFHSDGPERLYYKEFDTPGQNHGIAQNMDGDEAISLLGRIGYQDFSLESAFVSRDKTVPTGAFGTSFDDRRFKTIDTRLFSNLEYTHEFENDLRLQSRVYYDYYGYSGAYPYPDSPLNKDAVCAEWWGTEAQVSKLIFDQHLLTLGAEFRDDFRLDQRNYDDAPGGTNYLDSTRSATRYALFAEEESRIIDPIILNAGLRYDYFTTFGGTLNPRAALIYSPRTETVFKLVYGQAFRAPNANEFYYSGITQEANSALEPEQIRTYEFDFEQGLPFHLRLATSAFYNQIDNLITESTDPANGLLVYENVARAETKGTELELNGHYPGGWSGRLSYTLQRTTDAVSGQELSNSPRHLAKFNLAIPIYGERLSGGLEVQYASSVKTLAGNNANGFVLVNWTLLARKLSKGLEMSVSIYNLFDTHYGFPGAAEHVQDIIPQDGRTFRLKLTYRF